MYRRQTDASGATISVLRDDGLSIPADAANSDYAEYLAWVTAGNVPGDIPMSAVPVFVTPFQAKAALLNAGLLPQVQALLDAPETPEMYKLAWNEALMFERSSPIVAALAASLGLTEEQVDALFLDAKAAA